MTILLTLILGVIAVLHFTWARGIWFPYDDEAMLARAVTGFKGATQMPPPNAAYAVAGSLCLVIVALWIPWFTVTRLILWVASVVFLIRGFLAYAPFWREWTPEEPFATYDQRYYGPLCFVLGCGLMFRLMGL